jgi:hypothetical protein
VRLSLVFGVDDVSITYLQTQELQLCKIYVLAYMASASDAAIRLSVSGV